MGEKTPAPPHSHTPILPYDIIDLISRLVDKSLVGYEEQAGAARYRMLETVRQYARERLLESGEAEALRGRHLDFFVQWAEAAEPQLTGAEQEVWLERLETEHDNLRAALEWSLSPMAEGERRKAETTAFSPFALRPSPSEVGLRLAGAIWWFWYIRGYLSEGREWLKKAVDSYQLTVASSSPSTVNRQLSTLSLRAKALNGAGVLAWSQGDDGAARTLYEESLALRRELGDKGGIAISLTNLGNVACRQGDYGEARRLQQECLSLCQEIGYQRGVDYALAGLADVAYRQGDWAAAREFYRESLTIRRDIGEKRGIAESLEGLARVASGQGQIVGADLCVCPTMERAARLFGAAEALREAIGAPLPPSDHDEHERAVAATRAALGEEAFAAAWAEGRKMGMEEAVEYALSFGG